MISSSSSSTIDVRFTFMFDPSSREMYIETMDVNQEMLLLRIFVLSITFYIYNTCLHVI
jgi:hypothetical protein